MKALHSIGDSLTYRVGRMQVNLTWLCEDVYSVVAYQDTLRRHEWCKSWNTETGARGWALMVVAMARIEQNLAQPCGCRGVGWICTGAVWHPCMMCNSDRAIPAPVAG